MIINMFILCMKGLLALSERIGQAKFQGASQEELKSLTINKITKAPSDKSQYVKYQKWYIKTISMIFIISSFRCPICLSEFEVGQEVILLPQCTHRFHHSCIIEWLKTNRTCPICRTDINPPEKAF